MKYLLDTNTLSYAFRGEGGVARRMLAQAPAELGIPSPVVYEASAGILRLAPGARRESMLAALERLLTTIAVAPLDALAARAAAEVRAALEERGSPIGPIDTLIAGIAIARGAILVTRNLREFGCVSALSIEDWY